MQDNTVAVTQALLQIMGKRVDTATLEDVLVSAPTYPSLASVYDALETLGVTSEALEADPQRFSELSIPHLAHLKNNSVALVKRVDRAEVSFDDGSGKLQNVPLERYLRMWTGIVLVPTGIKESAYVPPSGSPRFSAVIVGASVLSLMALFCILEWPRNALFLISPLLCKLAGLTVCWFLFLEDQGFDSPASRFCRRGAKVSCKSVLSSAAAMFGPLSMVDIGVGYFAGGLLALLLAPLAAGGESAVGFALKWANLLVLPYTVFSIGYQGLRLRQWCPLCLFVQLVLWLEAVALLAVPIWTRPTLSSGALAVMTLIPLPLLTWLLLKPILQNSLKLRGIRIRHERLVRHPAVIRALIMEEEEVSLSAVPMQIVFGGGATRETVTIYTDLSCFHCATRHRELEKVIERRSNPLRIVVRLLGPMEEDPRALSVLNRIAELLAGNRTDAAHSLLSRWFSGKMKDAETSASALSPQAEEILRLHREMDKNPPFHLVPAIFFAGRPWPEHLPLSSLIYLENEE
jgi:uncharacterized membrane protein